MPWKEVKPMQQKVLFIADYLRQRGDGPSAKPRWFAFTANRVVQCFANAKNKSVQDYPGGWASNQNLVLSHFCA